MPLTIWCDVPLPREAWERLRRGAQAHVLVDARHPGAFHATAPEDPRLEEADVAFGQPDPAQVASCARLSWVHLSSAGYTAYEGQGLLAALSSRGARLTNSSWVYDAPCAEHALAMILALARCLPFAHDEQRGGRAWLQAPLRARSRPLSGLRVLVVGHGAIGRRFAALAAPLGMLVEGVRRRPRGEEAVPVFPLERLDERLAAADVVLDVLPASQSTRGFFSAARFGAMREGAFFVNIGRGATVDQEALVEALAAGRLAGAYLDVMEPEPLPPGSPLWSAPRCFLTPHTAGGRVDEMDRLVEHFLQNLFRYERGEALLDRVA